MNTNAKQRKGLAFLVAMMLAFTAIVPMMTMADSSTQNANLNEDVKQLEDDTDSASDDENGDPSLDSGNDASSMINGEMASTKTTTSEANSGTESSDPPTKASGEVDRPYVSTAGYKWLISTTMTDDKDQPFTNLNIPDTIKINLLLSITGIDPGEGFNPEPGSDFFDKSLELYIAKDGAAAAPIITNPNIVGVGSTFQSNEKLFKSTTNYKVVSASAIPPNFKIDGITEYYYYSLELNNSAEALEAWRETPNIAVQAAIYIKRDKTFVPQEDYDLIKVSTESSIIVSGESIIHVPEPDPEPTPAAITEGALDYNKILTHAYRSSAGNNIYDSLAGYDGSNNLNVPLKDGDLLVFRINASVKDGDYAYIKSIYDRMGVGLQFVPVNTPISFTGSAASNEAGQLSASELAGIKSVSDLYKAFTDQKTYEYTLKNDWNHASTTAENENVYKLEVQNTTSSALTSQGALEIKKGENHQFYIVAKVKVPAGSTNVTADQVRNSVKFNDDGGWKVTTGGGVVGNDIIYDVALRTDISKVYFTNGTEVTSANQIADSGVVGSDDSTYPNSKSGVSVYRDGYIRVTNTLYNQGSVSVKNLKVRAYYDPEAYEPVTSTVNDVLGSTNWTAIAPSPAPKPEWTGTSSSVSHRTYASVIAPGGNASQNLYLKVKDTNLSPERYYIACEIESFQGYDGTDRSKEDRDSLPDANPNNDLSGQAITVTNGQFERDNIVSEAGITALGTARTRVVGQDEDDFDYTYPLLKENIYDMALQTRITDVFGKEGFRHKNNGLTTYSRANVPSGGSIEVTVRLTNQGSLPVSGTTVYAYIPKNGYKLIENADKLNDRTTVSAINGWTLVTDATAPSAAQYTSGEYYVLSYTFADTIGRAAPSKDLPKIYLDLVGTASEDNGTITPASVLGDVNYFISAEIVEFKDASGTKSTSSTGALQIQDQDSIPDKNPNNDLMGTNIAAQVLGSSPIKEYDDDILHRGQTAPGSTRSQTDEDEDDFDFTFIGYITPPSPQKEKATDSAILEKIQVSDSAEAARIFKELAGNRKAGDINPPGLSAPETSAILTDPYKYVVYKITINEDGIQKLHTNGLNNVTPSAFREIIPQGMTILNAADSSSQPNYFVKLERTIGAPMAVDPNGGEFIDKDNSKTETINLDGTGNNITSTYVNGSWSNASKYGIESRLIKGASGANDVLEFTFANTPTLGNPAQDYYNNVEYTMYVVMALDNKIAPDANMELNNVVELDYPDSSETFREECELTFTSNVAIAGIMKYVFDSKTGKYTTKYAVAIPEPKPNLLDPSKTDEMAIDQEYRVVLPSNITNGGKFNPQTVSFVDKGDDRYIDTEAPKNVTISAFKMNAPQLSQKLLDKDLSSLASYGIESKMTIKTPNPTVDKTGFESYNDKDITESMVHAYDYSFRYKNLKYGETVRNTALRSVYTVTPLKINFAKLDQDDITKPLTGWSFTAYYYDFAPDGSVVTGAAVKDIDGNDIVITDTTATQYFIPEGFVVGRTGSANIMLVEDRAPHGTPLGSGLGEYDKNAGMRFEMLVKWTSKGFITTEFVSNAGNPTNVGLLDVLVDPDTNEVFLKAFNASEIEIACEVDKDTIKRTSAAFAGTDTTTGTHGANNVGSHDERYRYDVDFRSTANTQAAEFVYDDSLENVNEGIYVEEVYTPIVYGDLDKKFNVLYKTNMRNDPTHNPGVQAAGTVTPLEYPNTGWYLWASDLDTTSRHNLKISDLGMQTGEYLTAIRLDYGAVDVGFTSKNYSDVSLNGEHRDNTGIKLPDGNNNKLNPEVLSLENISVLALATANTYATVLQGSIVAPFATGIVDDPTTGKTYVDWTPDSTTSHYSLGALNARGLAPMSYMVKSTEEFEDIDIVSSASSRIALLGMTDNDHDAVLTKEIVTVEFVPEDKPVNHLEEDGQTDIPTEVKETDVEGPQREPVTGDEMRLALWIMLFIVVGGALVGAIVAMKKIKKQASKGGAK